MIAEMLDLENIMNDESLLPRRSLQLKTSQLWGASYQYARGYRGRVIRRKTFK